jgi:hypothetical protein
MGERTMIELTLAPYIIGLLSSAVSELFKLFPTLSSKETYKVLTAVVVMVAGTLFSVNFDIHAWDWNMFGQVVMWSFLNYKMIVQPVAKDLELRSQPR